MTIKHACVTLDSEWLSILVDILPSALCTHSAIGQTDSHAFESLCVAANVKVKKKLRRTFHSALNFLHSSVSDSIFCVVVVDIAQCSVFCARIRERHSCIESTFEIHFVFDLVLVLSRMLLLILVLYFVNAQIWNFGYSKNANNNLCDL